MICAQDKNGKLYAADEVSRKKARHLLCPGCHRPVLLRRGEQVIAHFAHLAGQCCEYESEAESQEHIRGKLMLADALSGQGYQIEMEAYLPQIKQRPDLLVNQKYPLEIQCSDLSFRRLKERNDGYRSIGMTPHWILGEKFLPDRKLTPFHKACLFEINGEPTLAFLNAREEGLLLLSHFKSVNRSERVSFIRRVSDFDQMTDDLPFSDKRIVEPRVQIARNKKLFAESVHYQNPKIRPFCQQLYKAGQTWLDLPDIVFHTISSEWMLAGVPEYWKWLFVKEFLAGSSRLITRKDIKNWLQKNPIQWHYLPFLSETTQYRPLNEWLKLLEENDYISQKSKTVWLVKNNI